MSKKVPPRNKPQTATPPIASAAANSASRNTPPAATTVGAPRYDWLLPLLAILAVSAVVFLPALSPEFVNWDDDRYVTDNTLLQPLSWKTFYNIFTNEVSANYNPWAIWSLAIDNSFVGHKNDVALLYHVHNLVLHLLCTVVVFFWARAMGFGKWAVYVIALLFGMHTMRVESVAWVTERKDVLFGFYYMAAAVTYLYYVRGGERRWLWYGATLALFMMSTLSKIQGVAFPLGMLAVDVWLGRSVLPSFLQNRWVTPQPENENNNRDTYLLTLPTTYWEKIPMFGISLALGLVGIYFLGVKNDTMDAGTLYSLGERLFFAPYALCVYLIKFFTPVYLSACHPYPAKVGDMLPVKYFLSPIPLVILAGVAYYLRWYRSRVFWFGVLFFFFNIVFLLQIVGAGQAFLAERFTYVAYVGFFALFGWCFQYVEDNLPSWRTAMRYGTLAWLGVLCVMTYKRSEIWHDSLSLWSDVLTKYEFVDVAYNNMGTYYRDHQQPDKAIENYTKVLERKPDDANVHLNRGNVYFGRNQNDEAAVDYDKVIALGVKDKDTRSKAFGNRGAIFFRKNQHDKAVEYIGSALKIDDNYPDAYLNRGVTWSVLGGIAEQQPQVYAQLYGQKLPYTATEIRQKAFDDYSKYISLKQDNAKPYNWRGIENNWFKRYDKAAEDFTTAINLAGVDAPESGEYYANRAVANYGLGKAAETAQDVAKAKQLGYKNIPANLPQ